MQIGDTAAAALEAGISELLRQRLVQVVAVANPGAGNEWSAAVPAGYAWEVLAVRYLFTTSAVVANRSSSISYKDDQGRAWQNLPPQAVQAASIARSYQRALGSVSPSGLVDDLTSLGDEQPPLLSKWSVGSLTAALDPGDVYANVLLVVRQWSLVDVVAAAEWFARKQIPG